jgi:hypothetical protein
VAVRIVGIGRRCAGCVPDAGCFCSNGRYVMKFEVYEKHGKGGIVLPQARFKRVTDANIFCEILRKREKRYSDDTIHFVRTIKE